VKTIGRIRGIRRIISGLLAGEGLRFFSFNGSPFGSRCLAEVEDEAEGVRDVAAGDGRVFFEDGAADGNEGAFGSSNVGHKKVKDRAVWFPLFDVKAEGACFKSHQGLAAMGDGQAKNGAVKLEGLVPGVGPDDDIA